MFADYRIEEQIDEGVFTNTFSAFRRGLDKQVTLVILKPQYFEMVSVRENFLYQARLLAQLRHPQIVNVFDVGEKDGSLYMATEFMPQGYLSTWIERSETKLSWAQVAVLVADIAAALDFTHAHKDEKGQPLIHGNLSPDNIVLEYEQGVWSKLRAKLTNNGVWKKRENVDDTGDLYYINNNPEYISSEQAADYPLTPLSDQYSLGIIAYKLLTGQTPFHGGSAVTIYRNHKQHAPSLPSAINGNLTRDIDQVVLKSLSKDPSFRFENCMQFAAALEVAIESVQEKDFSSFIEQAEKAVSESNAVIAVAALNDARQIKPNSDEVRVLSESVKTLQRAITLYNEACESLSNASQIAQKIRNEEPNYPDDNKLLADLAPLHPTLWQRARKNSHIVLVTSLILTGFAVIIGIATIIYAETAGKETFRSTLVAIDRTTTPTFTPTPTTTPTPTYTPTYTPTPTFTPTFTITPRTPQP